MWGMPYIKWLGHAAFEVELQGKRILIDPWLSNPLSPVSPTDIGRADFILLTHDHFDHFGETVDIAKRTGATVVAIYEATLEVAEKGVAEASTLGMNIGGTVKLTNEIEVYMTPAVHSANRGAPAGFIIVSPEAVIYHAGDTAVFSDMELLGKMFPIDVALLPIGSTFTMGPREAAIATQMLRPRAVVPMHYNTFPAIRQSPERFKELVESYATRVKVLVVSPGDSIKLPL